MDILSVQIIFLLFLFLTGCITFGMVRVLNQHQGITLSFCVSVIIWVSLLYLMTEGLSLVKMLNRKAAFSVWALVVLIELLVILKHKSNSLIKWFREFVFLIKNSMRSVFKQPVEAILLLIIILLLVRSTFLALFTVPANWDSMTYHLSRIMYWIQHSSVTYYPTHIERQLYSPVLAEYIGLHLILITGGDYFINLIQNASVYGCAFIIYNMIKRMGCKRIWSISAVIVFLTMNIVQAEAVSTQVDLVATLFLLSFIYLLLDIVWVKKELRYSGGLIVEFIAIGLALAMGYLTKSHVLILSLVVVMYALFYRMHIGDKFSQLMGFGIISGISALILVAPSLVRNYVYSGDVLASQYMSGISIGTLNPKYAFVNLLKNYTLIAASHNSDSLQNVVIWVARLLHVNIDSEVISFGENPFIVRYSNNMDLASAEIFAILLIIAIGICIYRLIVVRNKNDVLGAVLLLQLLICMVVVRWQPWGIRLLLPAIIVAIIPVIYYLSVVCDSPSMKKFIAIVELVAMFLCIGQANGEYKYLREDAGNGYKWDSGRFERYFRYRGNAYPYSKMCDYIDKVKPLRIGFYNNGDSYQYPMMARYYNDIDFENVILGAANSEMNASYNPEIIVVSGEKLDTETTQICNSKEYYCVFYEEEWEDYSLWESIE